MSEITKFYLNQLQSQFGKNQLNRKEVAKVLNISLTTLENLINKDEFPIRYRRIGNSQKARYIFPIFEIASYLAFDNAA